MDNPGAKNERRDLMILLRNRRRRFRRRIRYYSSFIFSTNVFVGLLTANYVYCVLFATLFLTSLRVHSLQVNSNNYIAINLLGKLVIFLIFLYGGHRLLQKRYMTPWGITKAIIIAMTCLFVIWIYCYGYLTNDLCFHHVPEFAAIYHVFMHVVGSLGHSMIMVF